jgi:hypothetical protein
MSTPSRYAKKHTDPMFGNLSDDVCLKLQNHANNRLISSRLLKYEGSLTKEDVEQYQQLEQFVCWNAVPGRGCTVKTSGGKFNTMENIQVGLAAQSDPTISNLRNRNDEQIVFKNIKFQAAKLALCCQSNILYRDLESRGLETSHLCNSLVGCWRPVHLAAESHVTNLARNSHLGCPGWFWFLQEKQLICYCSHTPPCMFVRYIPSMRGFSTSSTTVAATSIPSDQPSPQI